MRTFRLKLVPVALAISLVLTVSSSVQAADPVASPKGVIAAVLYFDNQTGDASWDAIGRGIADMVVTDLTGVDGLVVVERSRIQALLAELDRQRTKFFDPKTAQKLGKGLGATHVITGALAKRDPTLRIDIRLVHVETGEVILADEVTGDSERFFELEAKLLARFAQVLSIRQGKLHGSGVKNLKTVKAYGDALAAADRGDLEGASKTLAQVVRDEPDFALGKRRYAEVLRKLHAAKAKRAGELAGAETKLQKRVREETAGKTAAGMGKMGEDGARRYLSYRVLGGNLVLRKLRDTLGPEGAGRLRQVPPAKHAEIMRLAAEYADNTAVFIRDLRAWRGVLRLPWHELNLSLTDTDNAEADRTGYGGEAGDWDFANPAWVARSIAEFILLGKPDHYGDINFVMTPTLADGDKTWAKRGFAFLAEALKEVDTQVEAEERPDMGGRVLDTWGEALLRQGDAMGAIARWQQILDRYPAHEDFAEFEAKIQAALRAAP